MDNNKIDVLAKIIWEYMLMHQELHPMEAIFVLGSNDIRVAERAADLYLEGFGKYIICSGGNGKASQFNVSEAEMFSEIIIKRGVPKEFVIKEPKSTNTGENVLFVKKLLSEKGLTFNSFILVQKPYMERRTFATFRKQWPEPECLVTSPLITYEEYAKDDEFKKRFINVMVGDLLRIKEYPKLGFQIEQKIPEAVWNAAQELLSLGFNKYIL